MEKFGCAGVVPGCGICSQGESHSWDHSHPSMGMEGMQGKSIRHCPGPTKAHQLAFILHLLCPGRHEDPLHMGKRIQRG